MKNCKQKILKRKDKKPPKMKSTGYTIKLKNWLPPCPERSWIWLHVLKTRVPCVAKPEL
jgi:hypothetical protein